MKQGIGLGTALKVAAWACVLVQLASGDAYWLRVEPTPSPPKRAYHAMAYDAESDRVIVFSGDEAVRANLFHSDTWAYDHNSSQWTNLNPENSPPGTAGHAMAYDSESDRIILFSGGGGYFIDTTWAFDFNSNSWTELHPASAPSGRFGNNMAYDAESDRIILFGGSVSGWQTIDDTWSYDFNTNTWTEMNPPTRPPARQYHSMAYDSESDRILLFGGADYTTESMPDYTEIYGDTWAYDFNSNTWTEMMSETSPSARVYTDMAYNEKRDRVVLFGGGTESFREIDINDLGHGNETWMYDFNANTWQQVITDQAPTYRKKHKLAYDIESDCLILFGGDKWLFQGSTSDYQNETWVSEDWAGYPVQIGDWVDTSAWLGWINVENAPWVYCLDLHCWMYLPEDHIHESGAWAWVAW